MASPRLRYLLEQYVMRRISPDEQAELTALLETAWESPDTETPVSPETWSRMLAGILEEPASVRRIPLFIRGAVAAVLVLLAGLGGYIWFMGRSGQPASADEPVLVRDAKPGGNRAMLTLSGGKTIMLDSVAYGQIATQGTARIAKTANGKLSYEASGGKPTDILYNTLSTPRGGQYELTLPDGSEVWLNAASSITYPTAFTGESRIVRITGEAYLEVARDPVRPFRVEAGDVSVNVLGTAFNVNAYSDETVSRTTLIQGSVQLVAPSAKAVILRPGEQGMRSVSGQLSIDRHPDLVSVLAWKNGSFRFNHTDLRTAMRQLSRWYDIDVIYEAGVPDIQFWGAIKRDLNLSDALRVLERSGVHFSIKGKKLIVRP